MPPSRSRLTCSRRTGLAAIAAGLVTPLRPRARAAAQESVTLTLVAYSTPREAYEEIIPLFQATAAGAGVAVETSFASSGEQSRAVESGLPADIVALSLAPDIDRLVPLGLVAEDWAEDEFNGFVTNSAGEVEIGGEVATALPPQRRKRRLRLPAVRRLQAHDGA